MPQQPDPGDIVVTDLGITDPAIVQFLKTTETGTNLQYELRNYIDVTGRTPESKEFAKWAAGYLMENPDVSFEDLSFLNNISNSTINLPNLDVSELDGYPEFESLVQDLPNFLNTFPNVLRALSYTTGFSEKKILQLMQPGKGPKVTVIKNLKDKNGFDILGHYDKNTKTLQIDDGYVNGLSIVNSPDRYQGIGLILVIGTLHEFAHYGTHENALVPVIKNRLKDPLYEPGWYFERAIQPSTNPGVLVPENAFEWLKYYKIKPKQ